MDIQPHLRIKNLSVSYGSTIALNNISVDIPDRKITAVIGPSGCGKSTLLRAMNRLLENGDGASISGTVMVDNDNIYEPQNDVTQVVKKWAFCRRSLTRCPCRSLIILLTGRASMA